MKKSRKYDDGGVVFAGGTPNFNEAAPMGVMQGARNRIQQIQADQMARQQSRNVAKDAMTARRDARLAEKIAPKNNQFLNLNKQTPPGYAGPVTPLKKGGKVSSASKRADGIAQRGKTRGKYV